MVSSSSIQDSENAPANQNPIIVTNETHNQVYYLSFFKDRILPMIYSEPFLQFNR